MQKFPAFFIGHGNPMNAILENEFTKNWQKIGKSFTSLPKAIISISAHYQTKDTKITSSNIQKTIYDFYGFPKELYQVKYDMIGSEKIAKEIQSLDKNIFLDYDFGIDHGTWTILKHIFPNIGKIPVLQISIDYKKDLKQHYELAKKLTDLRNNGFLIIGSGNIVHNLQTLNWENYDFEYSWAKNTNNLVKEFILKNDINSLTNIKNLGKDFILSMPTLEHFIPLIYILALKENNEKIEFFNDKIINGSLSMTSVKIF